MKTFHTFLRCFAFYYFEGNKILRFLINLRPQKNRFSQGTCIFIFAYIFNHFYANSLRFPKLLYFDSFSIFLASC